VVVFESGNKGGFRTAQVYTALSIKHFDPSTSSRS
jgi:hypothetical protein